MTYSSPQKTKILSTPLEQCEALEKKISQLDQNKVQLEANKLLQNKNKKLEETLSIQEKQLKLLQNEVKIIKEIWNKKMQCIIDENKKQIQEALLKQHEQFHMYICFSLEFNKFKTDLNKMQEKSLDVKKINQLFEAKNENLRGTLKKQQEQLNSLENEHKTLLEDFNEKNEFVISENRNLREKLAFQEEKINILQNKVKTIVSHHFNEIKVKVKVFSCPIGYEVDVFPTDTVREFKEKFAMINGVSVFKQKMIYNQKELTDENVTLDQIEVVRGSTIFYENKFDWDDMNGVVVVLKLSNGRKKDFFVELSITATVKELKNKFLNKYGIPLSDWKIIFNKKPISADDDHVRLTEIGVKDKDLIFAVPTHDAFKWISVHADDNRKEWFNVLLSDSVLLLKQNYEERTSVPVNEIQFCCEMPCSGDNSQRVSLKMQNDETLYDYDSEESIITFIHELQV